MSSTPAACSFFTGNLVVFLPQTSQCHTFPLSHPRSRISKNILEDHTGLVANADLCLWVFSLWAAFDLKTSFFSWMRCWSRDQGLAVGSCWLAPGRTFGPNSLHVLGFCQFKNPFGTLFSLEIATEGRFWFVCFLIDDKGGNTECQRNVPVTPRYGRPPYLVVIRTTPITTSSQIMVQMILYWFCEC